ncbi:hypothetical protein AB0F11_13890 [Streptomyces sp. NPDC032472]|uniref:hypothetical protein n=1 Tax=Streptomyces sp. NPDC032472 TaxID=3155018 RepID=UPI0033DB99DA
MVETDVAGGGQSPGMPAALYLHSSFARGVAEPEADCCTTTKVLVSNHPGGPVALPVERISFIAQSQDPRFITWQNLAHIPRGADG